MSSPRPSPLLRRDLSAGATPTAVNASLAPRRGVTLLELLIVLVLMGIAAAVVAPVFARRTTEPASPAAGVLARARRDAVRRAEPLRVQISTDGGWMMSSQRDGSVIDSGHVSAQAAGSMDVGAWDVDPMGGCLPVASTVARAPYDGLLCADAARATSNVALAMRRSVR